MRRLNHNIDNSNDTGVGLTELEPQQLEPHAPTDPETSYPSVENVPNSHHLAQPIIRHSPDVEAGRPSVIKDYCLEAINEGHTKCIWVCMKRGRKWIAKDIKLEAWDSPLGVYDLRKMCGWWKRHSLYSAVGVKEVMVCSH